MYKCEHDDDNDQIRIHPNEIKKTLHITHSHSIFIVAAAADPHRRKSKNGNPWENREKSARL